MEMKQLFIICDHDIVPATLSVEKKQVLAIRLTRLRENLFNDLDGPFTFLESEGGSDLVDLKQRSDEFKSTEAPLVKGCDHEVIDQFSKHVPLLSPLPRGSPHMNANAGTRYVASRIRINVLISVFKLESRTLDTAMVSDLFQQISQKEL